MKLWKASALRRAGQTPLFLARVSLALGSLVSLVLASGAGSHWH